MQASIQEELTSTMSAPQKTLQFNTYHVGDKKDTLNCPQMGLTDEDIPGLVAFLTENKGITNVYLGGNHIADEGAKALAKIPSIQALDLSNNKLTALAAEAFKANRTFIALYLANNNLGTLGIEILSKKFGLKILDVRQNNATLNLKTCQKFNRHTTLETLYISGNSVAAEAKLEGYPDVIHSIKCVGAIQGKGEMAEGLTRELEPHLPNTLILIVLECLGVDIPLKVKASDLSSQLQHTFLTPPRRKRLEEPASAPPPEHSDESTEKPGCGPE